MSKIFDIDFRKGSYRELITNTTPTKDSTSLFKESRKGKALYLNGSSNSFYLPVNIPSGTYTVEIAFKVRTSTNFTLFDARGVNSTGGGAGSGAGRINDNGAGQLTFSTGTAYVNGVQTAGGTSYTFERDTHLIVEGMTINSGRIHIAEDYEGTGNANAYIYYVRIYQGSIGTKQRDLLYQYFLNSKQIQKPINNFIKSKPTTLSENGLVAAYNMTRQGNTITDISGNGKDLTVTNIVDQTTRGVRINGTGYLSRAYFLTSKATKSISFRVMVNSNSDQNVIFTNYDGTARQHIWIESGYVYHYVYDGASKYQVRAPLTPQPGVRTNITFTHDETNQIFKFYINGVDTTVSSTGAISIATSTGTAIGYDLRGTTLFRGEIEDVRIYNRILTQAEITKYHNSQVGPTLLETFANNGADNIAKGIRNWTIASGTWKINENTTNQTSGLKVGDKYLECITAGIIRLPSKTAYGMWEFDWYKASTINLPRVYIISDKPTVGSENGYMLYSTTGAYIAINKLTNGAGSVLIGHNVTADITVATWYKVKITRKADGTFTLLMKGGNLIPTTGYGEYTLILAEGGTTNPRLDNSFTSSNYFMLDLDAGDRIANIKILDGITI